jgi:hypothetical protein
MVWKQLEPTPPHVTYLTLTSFLILYALFSLMIRNRLHLSEPPLATVFGIVTGPKALNFIRPYDWGKSNTRRILSTRTDQETQASVTTSSRKLRASLSAFNASPLV